MIAPEEIVPEEIAERLASLERLHDPHTTVIFGLKSREQKHQVWMRHDPAPLWKTCHTKNYWCYLSTPRSMPLSTFMQKLQTRFPNLKFLPWENCAGVTASIASVGESSYIPLALKLGVDAAISMVEDGYLEKARVYARACSPD
jgi:hypothetical protein